MNELNHEVNDNELLHLLKKGSQDAFEALYKKYFLLLVRFATTITEDFDESQSIANNAFIKLWRKPGLIENGDNMKNYLYVITKNLCRDFLRKRRKVKFQQLDQIDIDYHPIELDVSARIVDAEVYNKIISHLDSLPPGRRKIVALLMEGKSPKEIAHLLNTTEQHVSNQKRKALESVRRAREFFSAIRILLLQKKYKLLIINPQVVTSKKIVTSEV